MIGNNGSLRKSFKLMEKNLWKSTRIWDFGKKDIKSISALAFFHENDCQLLKCSRSLFLFFIVSSFFEFILEAFLLILCNFSAGWYDFSVSLKHRFKFVWFLERCLQFVWFLKRCFNFDRPWSVALVLTYSNALLQTLFWSDDSNLNLKRCCKLDCKALLQT